MPLSIKAHFRYDKCILPLLLKVHIKGRLSWPRFVVETTKPKLHNNSSKEKKNTKERVTTASVVLQISFSRTNLGKLSN